MRKKTRLAILSVLTFCLVLITGIAFAGCKKDETPKEGVSYTVIYESNGGAKLSNGTYTTGKKFNLPTPSIGSDPLMYGYTFVAWYYDEALTVQVDAKNIDLSYATKDKVITLYAKWTNMHKIYFDTKTSEIIEPKEYAYGTTVTIDSLPKPQSRVVGGTECSFLYWVSANNNEKRTEDFRMDAVDMYFYAAYDTGVNLNYELDDDGNYVPLTANGHTTHTTYRDYRLTDQTIYSVDMVLPANWAEYTDDCGPVFSATSFNEKGTTFEGGTFVTLYISCQTKSNGAIEFYGNADNIRTGQTTDTDCLGGYRVDGKVLKDSPYAQKFNAYTKSGEEAVFTFTFRRVEEEVSGETEVTYYIGIDGIEYFKMTNGKAMENTDFVGGNGNYVVSKKMTGEIVGFRSKTLGVKFRNITLNKADKAIVTFDAGKGTLEGEATREYSYEGGVTLPRPTREGYDFHHWEYLDRTTGRKVELQDGQPIPKSIYKLTVTAHWRKPGAKAYKVSFDTGIEDYTVPDVTEWWEGNALDFPSLRYPMYTYSGEWFYDSDRTKPVDLDEVDPSQADVRDKDTADQSFTLYADVEEREFLEGEGTELSPYLIEDAHDFIILATLVDEGMAFAGKNFKLTGNINLGDYTTLGSIVAPFSGILDGGNFTITANITGKDNVGLFAALKAATIKNLKLNVTITASGGTATTGVGGIAGYSSGDTVITDCEVSGSIDSTNAGGEAGIVGRVETGFVVTNSISRVTITESSTENNAFVGGIIGNSNGGIVTIRNCKNYGNITARGGFVGGIIGLMRTGGGILENCENYGNISGTYKVGGIAGCLRSNIKDSFVLGTATVNGSPASILPVYGIRTSSGVTTGDIGFVVGELDDNNGGKMPLGCGFIDAQGEKSYPQLAIVLHLDGGNIDGASTKTVNVNAGCGIGRLPEPVKSGYRFLGYFEENGEEPVTEDTVYEVKLTSVTLTAHWQKTVTITFDTAGGTLTNPDEATRTIDENAQIGALPEVKYDGQTFLGWFDGEDRVSAATTFATDKELTAHWEPVPTETEITFDALDGELQGDREKTLAVGTEIGSGLPTATKAGYRFAGWEDEDGELITEHTTFDRSAVTLKARYILQTKVTFTAGEGGSLQGTAERTVDAGTPIGGDLPTATTTATGETFDRWVDEEGNTVTEETAFGAEETEVTVTAKFGWDGTTVSDSLTGNGDEGSPYLIANGADLKYFANTVGSNTHVYKLTKDINLAGKAWTSIAIFKATLDGDSHTIEGLANPFINYFQDGEIKNVSFVVNINSTAQYTGAVANAVLTGAAPKATNVNVYGRVECSKDLHGGFFGAVRNALTMTNCTNYAEVVNTMPNNGNAFVGGLIGSVVDNAHAVITNCTNRGNVSSTSMHVGGIAGIVRQGGGTVSGCKNFGNISGSASGNVGGIVGLNRGALNDNACWSEAVINGKKASEWHRYGFHQMSPQTGPNGEPKEQNGYACGSLDNQNGGTESGNTLCNADGGAYTAE